MAEKILNTRIQLKYDTLANWVTKNPALLAGEIAVVTIDTNRIEDPKTNFQNVPNVMFKVGPGNFNDLKWASALAADVFAWAKEAGLTINKNGAGNVVASIEWDATANNGKGGIKYTTASVATAEGLQALQLEVYGQDGTADNSRIDKAEAAIDAIELDIENNRAAWAKDDNTIYTFAKSEDGKGIVITPSEGEGSTISFAFLTQDEVDNRITTATSGKLHTEDEIKTIAANEIGRLIDASGDAETLKSIGDLVDYAEKNAGDIAGLVTSVGTANTNASNAVTTAGEAKELATDASTTAGEAKELAQEAKEAATNATTGAAASAQAAKASEEAAKASENAAKASEEAAAGSAQTASTKAGEADASAQAAAGSADEAAASASEASGYAQTASTKASEAADSATQAVNNAAAASTSAGNAASSASAAFLSAEEAATSAEHAAAAVEDAGVEAEEARTAKTAAEEARDAAITAKEAAEASNTSATAIANEAKTLAGEAKTTAGEAKTIADQAKDAVDGLADIATSGNVNDLIQTQGDVLILYCGGAE